MTPKPHPFAVCDLCEKFSVALREDLRGLRETHSAISARDSSRCTAGARVFKEFDLSNYLPISDHPEIFLDLVAEKGKAVAIAGEGKSQN